MSRRGDLYSSAPLGLKDWPSALLNDQTYVEWFLRLKNIALSVFEWQNLPPEIDERFLELVLFDKGVAVFFYDDVAELYVALTTTYGGQMNIYHIPKRRTAYAPNGYHRTLDDSNSVLIFNNYLHTPTFTQTAIYARRLYEIERAIDVNVKTQKFPMMIKSSESQRMTMKQLYMQYDGNEPFIFGDKGMDTSGFAVLNTGAPFVADKLMDLKHQVFNEALTYYGVENANTDKAERLITSEVERNMGAVEAQRNALLNARQQACEQINRLFGLDIWVDFKKPKMPVATERNAEGNNTESQDVETDGADDE